MLFKPFRQLGIVSHSLPLQIQHQGQQYFITSPLQNTFSILSGKSMQLLLVGECIEGQIDSLAVFQEYTFCASGEKMYMYSRQKIVEEFRVGIDTHQILVLGDLVLTANPKSLLIYNYKTKELFNEIKTNLEITQCLHPSTYVNKILIGSHQGKMQLWNMKTHSLLHEFKSFGSPIVCLIQAPSIDIVAVGLLDGTIILHHLQQDREIMRFHQEGQVRALSFRTDGEPIMVSGNARGQVSIWNLNEQRLVHILQAHLSSIHTLFFFHGSPLLLTSSQDNSIKQFYFDSETSPRLLKSRSGHDLPPSHIEFLDDHTLVSFSGNQIRWTSLIRDAQNTSFSHSKQDIKPITGLAVSPIRKEWDSVITSHQNSKVAKTWSLQRKALGQHSLPSKDNTNIKCVGVSACGNFCFLGSQGGQIDKYNMQSGLFRSSFKGHIKAVTGILCDATNQYIFTSSLDQTFRIWDFNKGTLASTLDLPSCISQMKLHNESRLLALVCDDCTVRVVDIDTLKIVRIFQGHAHRITSLVFSPDGRWIVTSSLDSTIRTWDIPTSFLISIFTTPKVLLDLTKICTSLAFSKSGEYLVTTHVDEVGVYVWVNRGVYEFVPLSRVSDKQVQKVLFPSMSFPDSSESSDDEEPNGEIQLEWENLKQQDHLIQLSGLAKSRWMNLLNLESIKKRNKPTEPVKKPEKAPFFLQDLKQLDTPSADSTEKPKERVMKNVIGLESKFAQKLRKDDFLSSFQHLLHLNPSAIDLEIQSLPNDMLDSFLEMILVSLTKEQAFEVFLSFLAVFLRVYGELISEMDQDLISKLQQVVKDEWSRLEVDVMYGLCLVEFLGR